MVSSSHLGSPADIICPAPSSPTYARSLNAFRAWADASHGDDPTSRPAVVMQLCHPGRQSPRASGRSILQPSLAPSAIALDTGAGLLATAFGKIMWQTPRAMTGKDIQGVVQEFLRAARMARETGFDGVQLHASHGYVWPHEHINRRPTDAFPPSSYLLAQFISPNVGLFAHQIFLGPDASAAGQPANRRVRRLASRTHQTPLRDHRCHPERVSVQLWILCRYQAQQCRLRCASNLGRSRLRSLTLTAATRQAD